MEIKALQIIQRQNIPGGSNAEEVKGDAFAQILVNMTGLVEGEDLDIASDLLDLTEILPEQKEEEEERILFDPVNIPWLLMNYQKDFGSDPILENENMGQVELIVEELDSPTPSWLNQTEEIGELNSKTRVASDMASNIEHLVSVDFSYKEAEKDILKEETTVEGKINIQPSQDKEEIGLHVESKSIPKEELSLKEKSSPNAFTKLKEEMPSSNSEDNEMKFGTVLENFTLQKEIVHDSHNEPIAPRNVDFNENIQAVNDTIIELISLSGDGKDNTMKVQLFPKELGHVDVTLKMEEGKLVAKIFVENEQVRELFHNHMNQLNDKLASQDIHIDQVQIDLNLNSNDPANSSPHQNSKKNPFESNQSLPSQKRISEISISEEPTNQVEDINGLNILA